MATAKRGRRSCFCVPTHLGRGCFFVSGRNYTHGRRAAYTTPTTRCAMGSSLLSVPFPIFDTYAQPTTVFSVGNNVMDIRPELLGSLLWTSALYFGIFGPRWASIVHSGVSNALRASLGDGRAIAVADATHSLPFVLGGLACDAALRSAADGNAVGAVASGLTLAFYAGVGELERISRTRRAISDEEQALYEAFCKLGGTVLDKSGRCHLLDVRNAFAKAPGGRQVANASDATLRKFIRKYASNSRVSPNGFYRGLSVRAEFR